MQDSWKEYVPTYFIVVLPPGLEPGTTASKAVMISISPQEHVVLTVPKTFPRGKVFVSFKLYDSKISMRIVRRPQFTAWLCSGNHTSTRSQ